MRNAPFIEEIIITPSNVHLKTYVGWEVLKIQLTLTLKSLIFHQMFFFPWHFFMVNDSNKMTSTITQNV
jgi:hypothetical protein